MNGRADTNVYCGRERIVRALPHIHVIVGVDSFFGRKAITTKNFDGAVADHLVDVHIARRAGTGLKHIDRKLIIKLAVRNFLTGLKHRRHLLVIERLFARPGQLSQITIGHAAGEFNTPHCVNQVRGQFPAGNWKVFDGSLRLSSVKCIRWHLDFTHGVALGAKF